MERLRSLLYLPASKPRMLAKLGRLPADAVAVDLEDGVAPAEKEASRRFLVEAASEGRLAAGSRWMLRVNAASSPWFAEDVDLARRLMPEVVLLPKAERPDDVRALVEVCGSWGGEVGLMIETARGVTRVRQLAGLDERITLLVFGSADFRLSLGARPDTERRWERFALQEMLLAARAGGCTAIDSVYFRYRDEAGLRRHARLARELGFDGKSCIHPGQVVPIHEVFSSTRDELLWAGAVLDGWERQRGDERGVVVVDGEMIEALHVELARRIVLQGPGDP